MALLIVRTLGLLKKGADNKELEWKHKTEMRMRMRETLLAFFFFSVDSLNLTSSGDSVLIGMQTDLLLYSSAALSLALVFFFFFSHTGTEDYAYSTGRVC